MIKKLNDMLVTVERSSFACVPFLCVYDSMDKNNKSTKPLKNDKIFTPVSKFGRYVGING